MLDKYEIRYKNKMQTFNPLIGSSGINNSIDPNIIRNYRLKLESCRSFREVNDIKEKAKADNLLIKDNSGIVSRTERQCVNARIQGGAATMSKRAMINVYNSEELKRLGFRLLIAVHDELIGECPEENKEECKRLLSELMIESARPEVEVPMKCDTDDFKSWYLDVYSSEIRKEYDGYLETNDEDSAFNILKANHVESTEGLLKEIVYN